MNRYTILLLCRLLAGCPVKMPPPAKTAATVASENGRHTAPHVLVQLYSPAATKRLTNIEKKKTKTNRSVKHSILNSTVFPGPRILNSNSISELHTYIITVHNNYLAFRCVCMIHAVFGTARIVYETVRCPSVRLTVPFSRHRLAAVGMKGRRY